MDVEQAEKSSQLAGWERWNAEGGPKYPQEKVVQFCFHNYPREVRHHVHALDLGCGSGVHTVFLAREGFHVSACDLAEIAVQNTRRNLEGAGLDAEVSRCSIDALAYPPLSFDLVLCIGVLEAAGPATTREALARLRPMLRSGARGLFLFAADDDFRICPGDPLRLHGYTRREVEELFLSLFPKVWIDEYVTTYEAGRIRQRDWLVTIFAGTN